MKPVHPRNHGKEPQKTHSQKGRIYVEVDKETGKRLLEKVIEAWDAALLEHQRQGHRITEYPSFENNYCSSDIWLEYKYEFDNQSYAEEKAAWDAAVASYEEEMTVWQANEDRRRSGKENIEEKILKAERRLANLIAVRDGKPIPFP